MCSAGGRAVLRVIDREGIQQHCKEVGTHLLKRWAGSEAGSEVGVGLGSRRGL